MTHNRKLWLLVAVLTALWLFVFVVKPLMAQPYPPYAPDYSPNIYGPNADPYRGRGFERGYRDYRFDGYRNWAPMPRQTYRPDYPYQGRPYIGHWPSYGPWDR